MNGLLEFDHITYAYQDGKNQKLILDDASYIFETGKIYAIEGPSGSGKTTTLILAGGSRSASTRKSNLCGRTIKEIRIKSIPTKKCCHCFSVI